MTLNIFLIIYYIILAIFLLLGLYASWHALKYRYLGSAVLSMIIFFIVGLVIIILVSQMFIATIDWQQPIVLPQIEF